MIKNAAKQYSDIIDASDFGLDKDDPNDQKTIGQVQKMLEDCLGAYVTDQAKLVDRLDKLDKFLTDFSKLDGVS
jgi:hypothetical protein